jgi:hypothetical protein
MFTELAILYSKYKPEKLQEHLELFPDRISLPKVIRWCQTNGQWKELTYLYKASNEHENAAMTMITHPVEAWEHNEFKSIITKVNNLDTTYKVLICLPCACARSLPKQRCIKGCNYSYPCLNLTQLPCGLTLAKLKRCSRNSSYLISL